MIIHAIAMRYSKVLFNLATTKEELKAQLHALEVFVAMLEQRPEINLYFSSPHITYEQKEAVLKKSLKDTDPQLIQFILVLLKRRHFQYLPEIVKEFRRRINTANGVMEGLLTTAEPVDEETVKHLQAKWAKFFGKQLDLKVVIDPHLLGGGNLLIENYLIDFSVQGKLARLKDNLLSLKI